ncbi:histidine phosphotransferase family protein [Roseobacteraceae bacterium S113]
MQDHRTHLATLIASRICHDLISPVGAISNGLELMELSGGASDGPEMALISDSCASANGRIRFFRIAYGAANDTMRVSAAEVRSILSDMTHGSRLSVTWEHTEDASRADVQMAFLGLQCVELALRRGGAVTISLAPGRVVLEAQAERVSHDPTMWAYLDGPRNATGVMGEAMDIPASHVQFALLPMLAADQGRRPAYTINETSLSLVI